MADIITEKIAKPIVAQPSVPIQVPDVTSIPVKDSGTIDKPKADGNTTLTPEAVELLIPDENYLSSPLFYDVANYFNIESRDYDSAKNNLGEITEWAIRSAKSNDPGDVLLELKKVEQRLGAPSWGERRYKNVFRYVKLVLQKDSFSKQISSIERGTVDDNIK